MSPRLLHPAVWGPALVLLVTVACGGSSANPSGPSGQTSFLSGTWQGTVTIQVNPGDPSPPPPLSGPMTWTFEVTPQTNRQSFQTTVRSEHSWLPIMTTATTAITPGNTPPVQISTQGDFTSPRGVGARLLPFLPFTRLAVVGPFGVLPAPAA